MFSLQIPIGRASYLFTFAIVIATGAVGVHTTSFDTVKAVDQVPLREHRSLTYAEDIAYTSEDGLNESDSVAEIEDSKGFILSRERRGSSRPKWKDFTDVPSWSDWRGNCGNGKCEEGEWCRTCPEDCPCTENCGNGICEDGEGKSCPEDCLKVNSVCGDGICKRYGDGVYNSAYENEYNCPVDCKLSHRCGNGKCESTESCFTCQKDCGKCKGICGDGKCSSSESCGSCPRDCGRCNEKAGDGVCEYPLESIYSDDCDAETKKGKFKRVDGIRYKTILDARPNSQGYTDSSCENGSRDVPKGWQVAHNNARTRKAARQNYFQAGCLITADGTALPTKGTNYKCSSVPLTMTAKGDGRMEVSFDKMYCPGRILLESIKDVIRSDDFDKKKCPSNCKGHGKCNEITGECMCKGRWVGPNCGRKIGDMSVPKQKGGWYKPKKGITWQWQLQGEIDQSYDVDLYDVDFDTSPKIIRQLHDAGRKVMCYFSAGSWEKWRNDADLYPKMVRGGILTFATGDSFPDEAWLDLRRMDIVGPLMLNRLDAAKKKGCDAIEYDNADTITHRHKLKGEIELRTQLRVNKWLVAQAHVRNMGVALKNSDMFANFLSDTYDMVVNEECFVMGHCDNYWPFLNKNKPVLNAEYTGALCFYCKRAKGMGLSTIKKTPPLDACMVDCSHDYSEKVCKKAKYEDATGKPWKHAKFDGKKNKKGWCPMNQNRQKDECPYKRYNKCKPKRGY